MLVVRGVEDESREADRDQWAMPTGRPYQAGQFRGALRIRAEAHLARRLGVSAQPPVPPADTATGGRRLCAGWCLLVGCRHEHPLPDARRSLRAAAFW